MSLGQSLSSMEKEWLESGKAAAVAVTPSPDTCHDERAAQVESRVEDDFRPSVLAPIHEVPTRSRLHTAETDLIHNYCFSGTPANKQTLPADTSEHSLFEQQPADDTTRDDVSSVVSSLSKDDSFQRRPDRSLLSVRNGTASAMTRRAGLPPTEVSIPSTTSTPQEEHVHAQDSVTPEWLTLEQSLSSSSLTSNMSRPRPIARDQSAPAALMDPLWKRPAPRVRSVFSSSQAVARPTLGRNVSAPASNFSVASKTSTLSSCGDSIDALFNNDTDDSLSLSPNSARLLGERKFHRRVRSSGTMTAPTTASSSYAGSEGSFARRSKTTLEASRKISHYTGAADGAACCSIQAEQEFRQRNFVEKEIKHVINMMKQPIKKLPLIQNRVAENVDLKRSKGCLT